MVSLILHIHILLQCVFLLVVLLLIWLAALCVFESDLLQFARVNS